MDMHQNTEHYANQIDRLDKVSNDLVAENDNLKVQVAELQESANWDVVNALAELNDERALVADLKAQVEAYEAEASIQRRFAKDARNENKDLKAQVEKLSKYRIRVDHIDRYFEDNKIAMDMFIGWLRQNPYPEEHGNNLKCETPSCKAEAATDAEEPNAEQLRVNGWVWWRDKNWICPKCAEVYKKGA